MAVDGMGRVYDPKKEITSIMMSDPLISFLYELLRDSTPAGGLELALENTTPKQVDTLYSNVHLARYAADVTVRLRDKIDAPFEGKKPMTEDYERPITFEEWRDTHDDKCPVCLLEKADECCSCHINPPCDFCVCLHTEEDFQKWLKENAKPVPIVFKKDEVRGITFKQLRETCQSRVSWELPTRCRLATEKDSRVNIVCLEENCLVWKELKVSQ